MALGVGALPLGHQQGAKFRREAFEEILVCEHGCPMLATVGVIIELPEMYKLIDRARVALEIPNQLLVLTALLERREADLLIQLHRFRNLADTQRVSSQLQRHQWFPFHRCYSGDCLPLPRCLARHSKAFGRS
jgi:hypothetical protein